MPVMILALVGALLLAACGDADTAGSAAAVAPANSTTLEASGHASPASVAAAAGGILHEPLDGRSGELVNPDDSTMVLLYFDVAGVTPPIETWVEQDSRVVGAQGTAKTPMRTTVRQELEAGATAVKGIGRIRLSLNNANLSNYDPAYGEFTVRALSPASVIRFSAFRQKVELKFGNGRTAQIWRVPEAEAQVIADRIGNYRAVELDALLQITAVQPGMGGGTLVVDILEYELRENRGGTTIGRVRVAGE